MALDLLEVGTEPVLRGNREETIDQVLSLEGDAVIVVSEPDVVVPNLSIIDFVLDLVEPVPHEGRRS